MDAGQISFEGRRGKLGIMRCFLRHQAKVGPKKRDTIRVLDTQKGEKGVGTRNKGSKMY